MSCSCSTVAQDTRPFVVTSCLFTLMMVLSVTASCFALLSPSPCWCCSINPHYNPNLEKLTLNCTLSGVSSARGSSSITAHLSELLSLLWFAGDQEQWYPAVPFPCYLDGGRWMTLLRARAPQTDAAKAQWRNGAALLKGTCAPKQQKGPKGQISVLKSHGSWRTINGNGWNDIIAGVESFLQQWPCPAREYVLLVECFNGKVHSPWIFLLG